MKAPRIVLAAMLLLAVAGCPKKDPDITRPETPVAKPSGKLTMGHVATAIALPEPENPVVAVRLAFRTGSADDPKGKEGLTALTASLMTDGGTKKLSSAELVRALYPMAAQLSVQVDREMTVFAGQVHRDHLARFLPILTEVILEPRMDPKEFERLKTDAINDLTLRLRTSDDEELGQEALESMLAPDHPYAHPAVGTESGLKSLTLEDAIAHRARVFGQTRLTIGIAGGYDASSRADLESRLATLTLGDAPQTFPAPPIASDRNFLVVEKPAGSTAISMGFNIGVKRGDPGFHELRVAAAYFGEHRQQIGRLFDVIREKRGLNYGDYAYVEEFVQEGGSRFSVPNIPRRHQHFEIWIRPVETANSVFALRLALAEFENLLDKGLTKEDFESTRGYLMGYTRLFDQTTDRRLGFAIDDGGSKRGYLQDFRKSLETMTVEQVNEAIKTHLGGRALQIAIVTGDGKALSKTLLDRKPTPPKYASPKPAEIQAEDKVVQAIPIGAEVGRLKVVPSEDLFD